jgi:hypothetical protein
MQGFEDAPQARLCAGLSFLAATLLSGVDFTRCKISRRGGVRWLQNYKQDALLLAHEARTLAKSPVRAITGTGG